MNGHPLQNEVAAQRDPMEAWRGIVALVESGNVSEMRISSISRQRAVLVVNEVLTKLAQTHPGEYEYLAEQAVKAAKERYDANERRMGRPITRK